MVFLTINATLVYIPFSKWILVDMILWRIPVSSWIITQSIAIVVWETTLSIDWWYLIRILGFLCHVKYLINWSLLLPFIVIVIICVVINHRHSLYEIYVIINNMIHLLLYWNQTNVIINYRVHSELVLVIRCDTKPGSLESSVDH
jgi:hypothetical protein